MNSNHARVRPIACAPSHAQKQYAPVAPAGIGAGSESWTDEGTAQRRLYRILDRAIVILMVAILITLTLPVSVAVMEQRAVRQAVDRDPSPPRHELAINHHAD
jgi:hypothetical protein